jgi:anti-sigma B factor antagonist
MSLSLQYRQVGEVAVIDCHGRLIEGQESTAFRDYLDKLLPICPRIVLRLDRVDYIDSAGLGLLVRYFIRAQNAQGGLTIGEVSPRVAEVLRITRLHSVLQPYGTEADAIAAAHQPGAPHDAAFVSPRVLCVDRSPDVLAYLREVLKEAGYGALTATNLADAAILSRATRPSLVVVGPGLRGADELQRLTSGRSVVELPENFGSLDPAAAAEHVLAAVRLHIPTA